MGSRDSIAKGNAARIEGLSRVMVIGSPSNQEAKSSEKLSAGNLQVLSNMGGVYQTACNSLSHSMCHLNILLVYRVFGMFTFTEEGQLP